MSNQNPEQISTAELHRWFADWREDMRSSMTEIRNEQRRTNEHVQIAIKELGEARVRLTTAEIDINEAWAEAHRVAATVKEVDDKVNDTVRNAAFVSGGIAALAFLLKLWPFGK